MHCWEMSCTQLFQAQWGLLCQKSHPLDLYAMYSGNLISSRCDSHRYLRAVAVVPLKPPPAPRMSQQSKTTQASLTAGSTSQLPLPRRVTNTRWSDTSMAQGKQDENATNSCWHARNNDPSRQYARCGSPPSTTRSALPSDSVRSLCLVALPTYPFPFIVHQSLPVSSSWSSKLT